MAASSFAKPHAVKIYDLDDTLTGCKVYYQQANEALYRICLREVPGVTEAQARERFAQIEMDAINHTSGSFNRERYPNSMRETYRSFCRERGLSVSSSVEEECWQTGMAVYEAPYEVYPGVREMLGRYQEAGIPLGLCTKGEEGVQRRKIEMNGLEGFFQRIEVVAKKTPEALRAIADDLLRGHSGTGYMIGDSKRDDIAGGQAAGLRTVWVSEIAACDWNYDDAYAHIQPTYTVRRVTEMPSIVPIPALAQAPLTPPVSRGRRR